MCKRKTNVQTKKWYAFIPATVFLFCILTGCGHVESAKELYRYATEHYGDCEMTEKDSHGRSGHNAYTEIVCLDAEYGFTYTVKSYMYENNLDGATLGYLPVTVSDFESVYADYLYEALQDEIAAIEQETGTQYVLWGDWLTDRNGTGPDRYQPVTVFGIVKAEDSTSAGEAAVAIGTLYNDADTRGYFLFDRENNSVPEIIGKPMESVDRDESLGSLKVDDLEWHSIEEKKIQSYLEKAWTYDVTAEYVGQHSGVFSDTGADLEDVLHYGNNYPTSMDSPVVFYDFVTEDGKEFWITDFSVKPPYGEHKGACTNYEES